MIRGRVTYLRPVDRSDLPLLWEWANDEATMPYLKPRWPMSLAEAREGLDRLLGSETERSFIVHITRTGQAIGRADLRRIDPRNRSAELGFSLYDAAQRGKGYGADALRVLLSSAFDRLHLHRVELNVNEDNQRAQRLYRRLGFVVEGLVRDDDFAGGRYRHSYLMGLLEDEFRRNDGREGERG
ncbi:MAG TPA: GNAT family protein [Bacillota bacterium]|jgi:RimJ/RimL family protein N-acetyltransferase